MTLRIADKLGHRLLGERCSSRHNHGIASDVKQNYVSRDPDRSILWTIIRHPASRAMSEFFFFRVSRGKRNATEDSILEYIQRPKFKTHIVNYLKLKKFDTREQEIEHVIQNYDFIAVSERMAESLVVMSMIMKVPLADLVVLASKAEDYDDGGTPQGCVKLTRAWSTPKIDEYLAGDFLQNNYDAMLYQAANASLDLTIDALGRDQVMAGVARFHELAAKNTRECKEHTIFPCPVTLPNHKKEAQKSCYSFDAGCGHVCTDSALKTESDDEYDRLRMTG